MYILNTDTTAVASSDLGGDTSVEAVDAAFASDEANATDPVPTNDVQSEGGEPQAQPDPQGEGDTAERGQQEGKSQETPEWIDRIKQFKPDVDLNDPNAVQEAVWDMYRNIEKMHEPVKQELDTLKEQADSIQGMKQLLDWINDNPERSEEAQQFIKELQDREARKKFGEELPDEVLNQLREAEATKQRLDNLEQARKQEQEDRALETAIKKVSEFAKETGKEFDEAVLLDYMQKEGIMNPLAAFKTMHYDKDLIDSKRQGELSAQKKIQESNKNGVVFHKGNSGSTPAKSFSNEQEADQAMMKDIQSMLSSKDYA